MAENPNFIEENKEDLCASLQATIIDILLSKLVKAAKALDINTIAIAGGVSANSGLRNALTNEGKRRGWKVFLPELKFTTDNAAMVAMVGYHKYLNEQFAELGNSPIARMSNDGNDAF